MFSADVEVVPGLRHWRMCGAAVNNRCWSGGPRMTGASTISGSRARLSIGADRGGGQLEFWPALNPAAQMLDIRPALVAARAVIRIPLAWGEDP